LNYASHLNAISIKYTSINDQLSIEAFHIGTYPLTLSHTFIYDSIKNEKLVDFNKYVVDNDITEIKINAFLEANLPINYHIFIISAILENYKSNDNLNNFF
jgi:hypothetical protein